MNFEQASMESSLYASDSLGASIRGEFPIFSHHPDLVYLDTAATAHKPRQVIDAIERFYASEYATVHRAVYRPSVQATDRYNDTREAIRRYLHASDVSEIVFTRGTTDALNLVASGFGSAVLKPGDEILLSQVEHHSNIVPWQMAAKQTGALIKVIPVDLNGCLLWEGCVTPRTKIVAVSHMSNVTGSVHPIEAICADARKVGAYLVVDGAQAAAHMEVNVQKLDCDFYAFSGHKCYGPTGVGVLYGKREFLEKIRPVQGGGDMVGRVDFDETTYAPLPLRLEAGTPMIAGVIALGEAIRFIEKVGRHAIASYEDALLKRASSLLQSIPGSRIIGTAPEKGPILTFSIDGIHPLDLALFLDLKQIAIRTGHLCAQPALRAFGLETAARASFGVYNTAEEVDSLIKAISDAVKSLS